MFSKYKGEYDNNNEQCWREGGRKGGGKVEGRKTIRKTICPQGELSQDISRAEFWHDEGGKITNGKCRGRLTKWEGGGYLRDII